MRVLQVMIMAGALSGAAAATAYAGDLPAPTVRRSNSAATNRPAPRRTRVAPAPTAQKAPTTALKKTVKKATLPYRAPYQPRRTALPISGPRRSNVAARTRTYVPPLPGNWVDARPKTTAAKRSTPPKATPPKAARAQPSRTHAQRSRTHAQRSPTSVAALPAPTVRGVIAEVAPAPRRLGTTTYARPRRSATTSAPRTRTIVRRATPRRRPLRGSQLTVPCAPGQKEPILRTIRRSLRLVCPPGTCDG